MAGLIGYISVINSIMELMSVIVISESVIGEKKKKKGILEFVIYIVILACIVLVNFFGVGRLVSLLDFLLIFFLMLWWYRLKIINTISYTIFSALFVCIIELVVYIPANILSVIFLGNRDISLLAVFITLVICNVIKKKDLLLWVKQWAVKKEQMVYMFLIVLMIALITVMNALKFNEGVIFGWGIYLICSIIIFILTIYKFNLYNIEIKLNKGYMEKYSDTITNIQARQHKFMNQLDAVYLLFELYDNYDELVVKQKEALGHLQHYLMPHNILIINRPMLIAHIFEKICEAEDCGIIMETKFSCSLQDLDIKDNYLIEIVGNLLDNAIDEVNSRHLNEKISFSISITDEEYCISVCNEHSKIPYSVYNKFFEQGFTTKGAERGKGLPYVKRIVNRYGGRIEVGNVLLNEKNNFYIKVFFVI